jgi:AcrR family transcriptional regulator
LARKRTTVPKIPNDIRVERSIDALRDALLELIERKVLDQISIKEITETAGLSYPTFFRRFAGKEALLEEIAAAEVRRLLFLGEMAIDRHKSEDSPRAMCEYVQEHRKLWAALLTGGAASAMRNEFMRAAREIAEARPRRNPWLPLDLAIAFVTSGIFELFAWWMRQPEDYPVDNVIKLFNALIIDSAGRPRRNVLSEEYDAGETLAKPGADQWPSDVKRRASG